MGFFDQKLLDFQDSGGFSEESLWPSCNDFHINEYEFLEKKSYETKTQYIKYHDFLLKESKKDQLSK